MEKNWEYKGETFLLDGSERCYVKVTYAEHPDYVGYAGFNPDGVINGYPYSCTLSDAKVTRDGVRGENVRRNITEAVDTCCHLLQEAYQSFLVQQNFTSEAGCQSIHDWLNSLPDV